MRYWTGVIPASGKIPFLKLHGSVDWFRLRRRDDSEPWYDERIGMPLDGDHHHTKALDGAYQTAPEGRPLLLLGTFNKISDYSGGIYRDLHYAFRSSIREVERLVVCGYSFGDKGINSEILEWFYAKRGRRLIVIHPDPEALMRHARGAISSKWDGWKNKGAATCISKKFECVERDEFFNCISGPG